MTYHHKPHKPRPTVFLCSGSQMQILKVRKQLSKNGYNALLPSWSSAFKVDKNELSVFGLGEDFTNLQRARHFIYFTYLEDEWTFLMLGAALALGKRIILVHKGNYESKWLKMPQVIHFESFEDAQWSLFEQTLALVKKRKKALVCKLFSLNESLRLKRTYYKLKQQKKLMGKIKDLALEIKKRKAG